MRSGSFGNAIPVFGAWSEFHTRFAGSCANDIAVDVLYGRWKIFALTIPVAVVFGVLFWLFYVSFFIPIFPGVIHALWNLEATLSIMLAGVPVEEVLWAFTAALFTGPVFRVCSSDLYKAETISQSFREIRC